MALANLPALHPPNRSADEKTKMIPLIGPGLRRFIAISGITLLFLPKINLIAFGGESAGVRVDDIVLLTTAFLLFASLLINSARFATTNRIEIAVFGFIALMLLSNIGNLLVYGQSSILYSLRMLEYFIFFYVGYYYATFRSSIKTIIWTLLMANAVAIVLQAAGVVGGFSSDGYSAGLERAIGLTGGPWEVGVLINFAFAILVFGENRRPYFVLSLFAFTAALLLLTAARMPSLAHVFLLFYYFFQRSKNKIGIIVKLTLILIPCIAGLVLIPNPVQERSENLTNISENISAFNNAIGRINPDPAAPLDHPDTEISEDSDASWIMRTVKWSVAIKMYLNAAASWAWGIGPGHLGVAVDGGWIRLVSETGPIGIIFFIVICKRIANVSLSARAIIFALSISMFMIDIYMAYKVMSLLFFIVGFLICQIDQANPKIKRLHLRNRIQPNAASPRLSIIKH